MPRCKRCKTDYPDEKLFCPKCGAPNLETRGSATSTTQDTAGGSGSGRMERRAATGGLFAMPLPFAVVVIGLLLNPALQNWIFRIYMFVSAPLGIDAGNPPKILVWTMTYIPSSTAMFIVLITLGASVLRHRGSPLLRAAAVAVMAFTAISLFTSLSNYIRFVSM